jgi:hypothetical protein
MQCRTLYGAKERMVSWCKAGVKILINPFKSANKIRSVSDRKSEQSSGYRLFKHQFMASGLSEPSCENLWRSYTERQRLVYEARADQAGYDI